MNEYLLLCKAQSACIAVNAKGAEFMPSRKNFKNRCSQIESEGILELMYFSTYVTRFAKRGLIHSQFQDTLFIAIC